MDLFLLAGSQILAGLYCGLALGSSAGVRCLYYLYAGVFDLACISALVCHRTFLLSFGLGECYCVAAPHTRLYRNSLP